HAGIDELLQAADIQLRIAAAVRLVEAALGQAALDRHLAALEGAHGDAGARLLALLAAAGGLARAGADAAADPLARTRGARIVPKFVELHVILRGLGPMPCARSLQTSSRHAASARYGALF